MGWWRKANYQNKVEESTSYHHSQEIASHPSYCVHSQAVAACSCSYLAKSRTKSYYLYIKKTTLAPVEKKKLESLLIFFV